eukprot:6487316-Amphidinium_carterae.1
MLCCNVVFSGGSLSVDIVYVQPWHLATPEDGVESERVQAYRTRAICMKLAASTWNFTMFLGYSIDYAVTA